MQQASLDLSMQTLVSASATSGALPPIGRPLQDLALDAFLELDPGGHGKVRGPRTWEQAPIESSSTALKYLTHLSKVLETDTSLKTVQNSLKRIETTRPAVSDLIACRVGSGQSSRSARSARGGWPGA